MELRSTVGWAFIVFGTFFIVSLAYMWPQLYSPQVFDARMAYHTVMDIEDYWTCGKDYNNFVIDEPPIDEAMFQFFIFNISNAPDVIQKGYKPKVNEVGPYAYQKLSYKYEIYFDPDDATRVQFKEYTLLVEIPADNGKACDRMYHRVGRSDAQSVDPCENGFCSCRSHDEVATVINPLFMKMIWTESTQSVLAYFSVDVFTTVKLLLENEFVVATKAHLVSYAYGEIYQFRIQAQSHQIITAMYDQLSSVLGYTNAEIAHFHSYHTRYLQFDVGDEPPSSCNLDSIFDTYLSPVSPLPKIQFDCPIDSFNYVHLGSEARLDNDPTYATITEADVPDALAVFENPTSETSFLDAVNGVPGYLAMAWVYMVDFEFNSDAGHTMFNADDAAEMLESRARIYAEMVYGSTYTEANYLGSQIRILANMEYVAEIYSNNKAICKDLAYNEFSDANTQVTCNGLGMQCIWQYGYMQTVGGVNGEPPGNFPLNRDLKYFMIDIDTKLGTNPINLLYLGNSANFYSSYVYCSKVYRLGMLDDCDDLGFSYTAALLTQPAGLFGVKQGVDLVNTTLLNIGYRNLGVTEKNEYFHAMCNISHLVHEIYPGNTDFHDQYVIRFLNKYHDDGFTHQFTVGNWEEIGYAQFGGGFITDSLTFVRTTYQVKRDGMWHFGQEDLYAALMEYSSWSIKVGYPQAWIYDPLEARDLLIALADRSSDGVAFRRHIVFAGTTFVGDGVPDNYINEVGDVGEFAFTSEANRGDFACDGDFYENACNILNVFYTSSADAATQVNSIFEKCKSQFFKDDPWVVYCERFETSMTSPQQGIQVSFTDVYGHPHPYRKSRGNVLYEMLFSLTTDLKIKSGLWCQAFAGCDYGWGGMFTSAAIRQVLFQGFTEPSVLQYLNMKHEVDSINFRCAENSVGECGKEMLRCNEAGVIMTLPDNSERQISYFTTQKDEYFAPYLEIAVGTGEMVWEHSMTQSVRDRHADLKAANTPLVQVQNPFWTAYPAWNTDDIEFQKYFQCQKRTLFGLPGKFNSCFDTLNTGRKNYNDSRNQIEFYGNDTIYFFEKGMNVNGSTYLAHPMSMWDGFFSYNYTYQGKIIGDKYYDMVAPRIFNKINSLSLEMNQNSFTYHWQKNMLLQLPLIDSYTDRRYNRTREVYIRRFVEWFETWQPLAALGTPKDSYGMNYIIPTDMASLERLAGFPIFAGTPHAYGNKMWGGTEFGHVQGYEMNDLSQRTFVDYDPVTGRSIREVVRQQINIRVEKGPLYPNVFGSQQRCIAPTKAFSANTGYGCFAYVPLLWFEDARIISTVEFYRLHDHFFMRPERASFLQLIGTIVGTVTLFTGFCIVLNEAFHRRNFKRRVYVD